MLEPNTIKAILEAMLFVSDKPVTLRQMTAKVRHVVRKNQPQEPAPVFAPEDDAEVLVDDTGSAPRETDVACEDAATDENRAQVETQATDVESAADSEPESEGADDDVEAARVQLAQRQRELEDDVTLEQIKAQLFAIEEDLRRGDRGIELVQVAKGYQLRTKPDISSYLRDDKGAPPMRLSPSSLETLAIVAYEQPAPKHKVEDVRGVDCGGVLKTLLDRDFIRIVGRSDEPGRPLVYGTTAKFLEVFGLNSLKDLPNPSEFQDLAASAEGGVEVVPEGAEGTPEEGDGNVYVHAADFTEFDDDSFNESERAILDELDQSLAGLKGVEKGIDLFREKVAPEADSPVPETKN